MSIGVRVLDDPPLTGAENMARDEVLLDRVGAGLSPPTLRLYEWSSPTLSLGYFQPMDEVSRLGPPLCDLPVVRRLTGGGAILHDIELTYSLTLPLGHPMLSGGPNALYQRAHDAIRSCLHELGVVSWTGCADDGSGAARGPFFCFARRHCFDVLIGADKIVGSAQRRTTRAVLQHGSIIVGSRFDQQPVARLNVDPRETIRHLRVNMPSAFEAVARIMGPDAGPVTFTIGTWTDRERSGAAELLSKYGDGEWTRRA